MASTEEVMDKNLLTTEGFFTHMFNYDDETKHTILNMIQYTILCIVPVIVILKLIKEYVPEEDDSKSNMEISIEIVLQLGGLILAIWFIDRLIRYFPTFSKIPYNKGNELCFILPLLIILITMQTKLGAKINILVDRSSELWEGSSKQTNSRNSNNITVRQPIANTHQISRADVLDSQMLPPNNLPVNNNNNNNNNGGATLINNLPNLSNATENNPAMNLALNDECEPMAANGFASGAFASW